MTTYRSDLRALQAQSAAWSQSARFNVECMQATNPRAFEAIEQFRRQALRAQREAATYALWAILAMDALTSNHSID